MGAAREGSVSTQINRSLNPDLNPVGESRVPLSHMGKGEGKSEKLLKSQELVSVFFFLKK